MGKAYYTCAECGRHEYEVILLHYPFLTTFQNVTTHLSHEEDGSMLCLDCIKIELDESQWVTYPSKDGIGAVSRRKR